ncbi:uncharacterized protein LOC111077578 [Drosophila obscura]|uniref:uncharacterized protein LOC111077578 n=1 Tax=Drosophila obscura TaxID=7282 RepID=UPI001BB1D068|nr:uncharacterized protein LOC111077578 [Drosophila obscura]
MPMDHQFLANNSTMKYNRVMNKRKTSSQTPSPARESSVAAASSEDFGTMSYGALEMEAAAALLMLRYQYDRQAMPVHSTAMTRSPTPPHRLADKRTPKDQAVRTPDSAQPLKKRSIPTHLLRRSLTPAKSATKGGGSSSIVKAKSRLTPVPRRNDNDCNKVLLKSCRNMIREFLDNQELI